MQGGGNKPSIRAYFLALLLAGLLPIAAFAAVLLVQLWVGQRDQVRTAHEGSVQALAAMIEREVEGSVRRLEVLAASPVLRAGRIDEFRALSRENFLARSPDWDNILMVDSNGRQVFNLAVEPGQPLPPFLDRPHRRAAVDTVRPVLSDLFVARTSGKPVVEIAVPVVHDAQVRYVLSATLNLENLALLLTAQTDETKEVVALVDREHRHRRADPRHRSVHREASGARAAGRDAARPAGLEPVRRLRRGCGVQRMGAGPEPRLERRVRHGGRAHRAEPHAIARAARRARASRAARERLARDRGRAAHLGGNRLGGGCRTGPGRRSRGVDARDAHQGARRAGRIPPRRRRPPRCRGGRARRAARAGARRPRVRRSPEPGEGRVPRHARARAAQPALGDRQRGAPARARGPGRSPRPARRWR